MSYVAYPESFISDLYAAASGRKPWSEALGNLAHHLDLWVVQLLSVDVRTGQLLFNAYGGPGVTPQVYLDYVRFYNTIDPRAAPALATPADQWVQSDEHHDAAFVASHPYYRDFLTPAGGGHLTGTKLIEVGNAQFVLALVRRHGQPQPDAARMQFLQQVKHHLSQAMHNLAHLGQAHAELDMARELLGQFNYPMLLIDQGRAVWHSNALAQDLLARGDVLLQQDGLLVARRKEDDAALSQAVHELHLPPGAVRTETARKVVSVRRPDGSRCLLFLSALQPQETMGVFGTVSRVLLVVHDPALAGPALDPFVLAECFGFTPAEARIAVQLASGVNAKVIAQRTGLAVSTVRTSIKRVLEKTGVSRQADLVRLLLSIPARGG